MRERSFRRFMLITPEKVGVERLYCAVRWVDGWFVLMVQARAIYMLRCNTKKSIKSLI
jgi:hypothetical protein